MNPEGAAVIVAGPAIVLWNVLRERKPSRFWIVRKLRLRQVAYWFSVIVLGLGVETGAIILSHLGYI